MYRWRAVLLLCMVGTPALGAATDPVRRLDTGGCRGDDRVAALDLIATLAAPRVGEPTLLTLRINVMCSAPIAWRIEIAGRVLASGAHEPPPPPGGVLTIAATWTPATAGETTLRAFVDPDNVLGEPEAARKNNVVARTVAVAPAAQPIREPEPPPAPGPTPPPPPDGRGEPASRGTCTAWERRVDGRGEGVISVRRARGGPSGFDYVECARRLTNDVAKRHCSPEDRKQLAKKPWYLQPGDLSLVAQTAECR